MIINLLKGVGKGHFKTKSNVRCGRYQKTLRLVRLSVT